MAQSKMDEFFGTLKDTVVDEAIQRLRETDAGKRVETGAKNQAIGAIVQSQEFIWGVAAAAVIVLFLAVK